MYVYSYNMNIEFVLNMAEKLNLEMVWESKKSSQVMYYQQTHSLRTKSAE